MNVAVLFDVAREFLVLSLLSLGGANAIIETITDTAAGKGQKIRFEVMSGFYMPPHKGERLILTPGPNRTPTDSA